MSNINYVDICCGLAWGDEAKGKIVSSLAATGNYDYVCRWAGGNNAGHTIYINNEKYHTHLIPSGVFFNIPSIIGPDCVIHEKSFFKELEYLSKNKFDTSVIKISPKAHIVTDEHIKQDIQHIHKIQGTTARGIAPCYRDKYARKGIQAYKVNSLKSYLWDGKLSGNVLCEGAQGFWLDINHGNYPYVTSSTTLPYGACSLGFPHQYIRHIYGAAKIYDTRSGKDSLFPEDLLEDEELMSVALRGKEYGVTTGRQRKVNWLNLDKLIYAINITGTTYVIISKTDILQEVSLFKLFYNEKLCAYHSIDDMKLYINNIIKKKCKLIQFITYSDSVNIENILN